MTEYNFQADISRFDTEATGYNGENSFFLADCAKLAYEPEGVIQTVFKDKLNFENFHFFDSKKSTQAYIAGNKSIIIVAFRGTEKKGADFLADLKLRLEKDTEEEAENSFPGKVHRGFYGALKEVWGELDEDKDKDENMREFLKTYRDNNQSIWFCGHSLGAALATLAAAEHAIEGSASDAEAVKGIYTIGQPRVGDNDFAEAYDRVLGEKHFRVVNNNDVVTHLPPPGVVLKYTHVGLERYINSEGKLLITIPWWHKIWDQFAGVRKDIGDKGLDALKDHFSEGYVNLLKNNRAVM